MTVRVFKGHDDTLLVEMPAEYWRSLYTVTRFVAGPFTSRRRHTTELGDQLQLTGRMPERAEYLSWLRGEARASGIDFLPNSLPVAERTEAAQELPIWPQRSPWVFETSPIRSQPEPEFAPLRIDMEDSF